METSGTSAESPDPKDERITSFTSFMRLYSQRRDRLQRASESFTLTAARLREMQKEISKNKIDPSLLSVFGGVVGAACGGVTGGAGGALGAVGAATCARFCGHINAVGATVGFVGSVLGGAVGGVFSGTVGGAICAAAKGTGSPADGAVGDVAWFTIGCATGGAIGGIFGGTVGAAGGAFGGAFGGLYAARFAGYLVGYFCKSKDSKESVKTDMMQKSGDFSEAIKPLVEELKTVQSICDKMASREVVRGVAAQTAQTLSSVSTMETTISDCQRTTDLPQFVSRFEEAARQSQKITEEVDETKTEADALLVSLRKH